MREILFKAKPCYTGGIKSAWVYGTFQYIAQRRINPNATDNGTLEPRTDKGRILDLYGTETEVLCDTLGQFTGMTDKNGVKIFEGDIVCKRDLTFNLQYKGVVVYNSSIGCFRIHIEGESKGTTMRMGFEASDVYNDGKCTVPVKYDYEVIGNIHDDPKLIGINKKFTDIMTKEERQFTKDRF